MRPDKFDALAEALSNWGRWGPEDQRGTLNHITPEVLKGAAAEVLSGKVFSLGLPFSAKGPQAGGTGRFNPKLYVTDVATPMNPAFPSAKFTDDVIHMPLQAATQWDALAHVHYDGKLYNDHDPECLTAHGATCLGVEHIANPGIVSRGVLLDVARHYGVEVLPADHAVSPDDLNACAERQGVEVRVGDVVLIRTGHIRRFVVDKDRRAFMGPQPGLSYHAAEWLYDRSAAAVAADNFAVEHISMEMWRSEMPLPFHMLALRDMGMPLGEIFTLEALAADCAEDGRYSFQLCAPALGVVGAAGSPVNPLALK